MIFFFLIPNVGGGFPSLSFFPLSISLLPWAIAFPHRKGIFCQPSASWNPPFWAPSLPRSNLVGPSRPGPGPYWKNTSLRKSIGCWRGFCFEGREREREGWCRRSGDLGPPTIKRKPLLSHDTVTFACLVHMIVVANSTPSLSLSLGHCFFSHHESFFNPTHGWTWMKVKLKSLVINCRLTLGRGVFSVFPIRTLDRGVAQARFQKAAPPIDPKEKGKHLQKETTIVSHAEFQRTY